MLSVPVLLFLSKRDSLTGMWLEVAPCNLLVEKETVGSADWSDCVVTGKQHCLEWLSQGNRDTITPHNTPRWTSRHGHLKMATLDER